MPELHPVFEQTCFFCPVFFSTLPQNYSNLEISGMPRALVIGFPLVWCQPGTDSVTCHCYVVARCDVALIGVRYIFQ